MEGKIIKSETHVMLDIETLGGGAKASIISIGAVEFDPDVGNVLDKFYVGIVHESFPTMTAYRGLNSKRLSLDKIWESPPDGTQAEALNSPA